MERKNMKPLSVAVYPRKCVVNGICHTLANVCQYTICEMALSLIPSGVGLCFVLNSLPA